jgi:hypothetical protein
MIAPLNSQSCFTQDDAELTIERAGRVAERFRFDTKLIVVAKWVIMLVGHKNCLAD